MKHFFSILLLACCLAAGCSNTIKIRSELFHAWAKYSTTLRGYLRTPEGEGPFPTVVLMHGCSGLTDRMRRGQGALSDYLIRHGFATLMLDSFGPRYIGGEGVCDSIEAFSALRYRSYDAYYALNYLKTQPTVDPNNIFLVGHSHGGAVAINVASEIPYGVSTDTKFSALVSYYPWCGPWGMPETLISPLMLFLAEDDDWCPAIDCQPDSWAVTGEERKYVVYPNTHHAFDMPGPRRFYRGYTLEENLAATSDSREKLVRFFRRHMQ